MKILKFMYASEWYIDIGIINDCSTLVIIYFQSFDFEIERSPSQLTEFVFEVPVHWSRINAQNARIEFPAHVKIVAVVDHLDHWMLQHFVEYCGVATYRKPLVQVGEIEIIEAEPNRQS